MRRGRPIGFMDAPVASLSEEPAGSRECGDPFCTTRVRGFKEDGRPRAFCKRHQAVLDRIREEVNSTEFMKRFSAKRTCCWPGCAEPREDGDTYCYKGEDGH